VIVSQKKARIATSWNCRNFLQRPSCRRVDD